jgi:hypothetical protein
MLGAGFWTILSGIVGMIGLVFTVLTFWQWSSDKSKALNVELISQSSLVNENVHHKPQIVVLYDNRQITNYVSLQFSVVNNGAQVIRSADYEDNFYLSFSNISEILDAELVSSDPKHLPVKPEVCSPKLSPGCQKSGVTPQSVWLSPALLNPKDWYIVAVSVIPEEEKKVEVEPRGRIAGVKQIEFKGYISPPKTQELTRERLQFSIITLVSGVLLLAQSFYLWKLSTKLRER